ncbi:MULTISPECIES: sporulation protein YqfC [unclassified Sporolactobacillus]|uniref:sporulation protein YqfC n=1 Tax=unclassified Sporolactobacillus TaxID=2628533 RepID=UPI002367E30B|nr:sporulation protein YqfC [Sporolactobacillus sp. CQH2019]MDD9147590.1 sporulation protein YqfC [Sporolactobacillus sp. CQH2019]
MKKWTARFRKWFAAVSDIPADVVMDLPRITLIGQFHLSIENHTEVLAFSQNELKLALQNGELHITGEGFVLENVLEKEIYLEGRVKDVRFVND